MDEQRFDQLSRRLAGMRTRRQAIKAIAGAVVASVAGVRAVDAQSCTAHYSPCSGDGQCCAGSVCEYGLCMPGCRIDGAFTSAWMSPPGNICAQCRPELSTTSWSTANEGMSCWSGDPSAGATFCQNGECRANGPTNCAPPPACFTDQLIDPATCTYAPAPAGTVCGGQAMCHGEFYQPADTCDGNGFCISGDTQTTSCFPYVCGMSACTTSCGGDGDCASGATCCDGHCVVLGTVEHCGACNDACVAPDACTPASCDDGVCATETACRAPDACTPATCEDGVCTTETACAPVDACTPAFCDNGVCNTESACTPPDACTPASCDDGVCATETACMPVDTCTPAFCDDGVCNTESSCVAPDACTPASCENGVCNTETACVPVDACTPAFCDNGACNALSACGDGEVCEGGECVSTCLELSSVCDSADQCCDGADCAVVANPGITECCLELGAAGCTGQWNDWQGCCSVPVAGGGRTRIFCGNGVCGGGGAACIDELDCASGVCCSNSSTGMRACCGDGEVCDGSQCVPATP